MTEFIQQDKNLLVFLNNLGNNHFDPFWEMVSGTWVWVPLYIIFLYLLYKNYQLKSLIFILVFVALGVTASDQISGIFKYGVARLRPCHDPSIEHLLRVVKCGGKYGFYSAHASNTFFIATFMTMMLKGKYRYLPYLLFFWAAFVSYSRIYLGVHFPFDVTFGALAGFLLGGFFSTLARNVIRKQNIENVKK